MGTPPPDGPPGSVDVVLPLPISEQEGLPSTPPPPQGPTDPAADPATQSATP